MAVHRNSTGFYGIGAVKKDFGFSSNLTLPLASNYSWPQPATGDMPREGTNKGRATFTVRREEKVDITSVETLCV